MQRLDDLIDDLVNKINSYPSISKTMVMQAAKWLEKDIRAKSLSVREALVEKLGLDIGDVKPEIRPSLLAENITLLVDIGIKDIPYTFYRNPRLVRNSVKKQIDDKYRYLHRYSFTKKDIKEMARKHPEFLFRGIDNKIKPLVEYLKSFRVKNEILRKALVTNPRFFDHIIDLIKKNLFGCVGL
jgi:hypothetical protein